MSGECDKLPSFSVIITVSLHTSRCSARYVHELVSIFLFFRFLLMVSLYRRRGHPRGLCPCGNCEYRACLSRPAICIYKRCPVQRRYFLMRKSSIEGNPARLRTFMLVTLSCRLIFMIDRRYLIMKACSFFTCLM